MKAIVLASILSVIILIGCSDQSTNVDPVAKMVVLKCIWLIHRPRLIRNYLRYQVEVRKAEAIQQAVRFIA
ncbi:MAG: hypothetical protein U5J96_14620 [Ignavibacteriaceae bacterium]|nr:hypothetical protein [Ignavibacteriaceae bacterium]